MRSGHAINEKALAADKVVQHGGTVQQLESRFGFVVGQILVGAECAGCVGGVVGVGDGADVECVAVERSMRECPAGYGLEREL